MRSRTPLIAAVLLLGAVLPSFSQEPGSQAYASHPDAIFYEGFDEGWDSRWIHSTHSKYDGKFSLHKPEEWSDAGLRVPDKSKHYGLTALLPQAVDPSEGLVVQYEVRFTEGVNCGGSYIKLLTHREGFAAGDLVDSTPYTIMFGPDKCGANNKVHLILRHANPLNGSISEKHLREPPQATTDRLTHVYTLRIMPDNKFEILIDGEQKALGSLLDKLDPPINPPAEIPDPTDIKPKDWVDEAQIPDPSATKPADWDERKEVEDMEAVKPAGWLEEEQPLINDPAARQPSDWSDEEDGAWLPPQLANPKCKGGCGPWKRPMKANPAYKGEWKPPLIDNPAYKGPWVQRQVPNPDHYHDDEPLKAVGRIGALAIEIWTIDSGYVFDNFLLTRSDELARQLREEGWRAKHTAEKAAEEKRLEEDRKKLDKERKAKDKDKKARANKALGGGTWLLDAVPNTVVKAIKALAKRVKAVRPVTRPLVKRLERTPALAYLLILTPPGLITMLVLMCLPRRKRQSDYDPGYAKKHDLSLPDDDEEEEAEEEAGPSGDAEGGAKAKKDSEEAAGQQQQQEEEAAAPAKGAAKAEGVAEEEAKPKAPPAPSTSQAAKAEPAAEEREEGEGEEESKGPTKRRTRRAD